jgi:hypothetical protein
MTGMTGVLMFLGTRDNRGIFSCNVDDFNLRIISKCDHTCMIQTKHGGTVSDLVIVSACGRATLVRARITI